MDSGSGHLPPERDSLWADKSRWGHRAAMSPPASERAEPIAPHGHVTHTLRPSYGARTARCATAIEIRFSSSEHDFAYASLEVIGTGRGKLPPRHLPATPHAHRVVSKPFGQLVEDLIQRCLAGQQFNQAAL